MSGARRTGLLVVATVLAAPVVGLGASPAQAAPKPRMQVFDATLTEGTGGRAILAFAVQLSAPAPSAVPFTWGTRGGTAVAGVDYTPVPAGTTARIAKGSTSTALVVRVAADAVDEYTETLGVHLAGAPSSVTVGDADATATILDDDEAPVISVVPAQIVEGTDAGGPITRTLTASLSQPSGKPISVRYAVAGGTAEVGSDLEASAARLGFPPGATSAQVTVTSHGDAVDEPHKAFSLAWAAPVNVRVPARRTPVTLLDDDGPLRPSILGTTPVGPSPDADPLVYGLAPARSTVEVYRNGGCNGSPVATGSAEVFTGSGFAVPMASNATNTLTVKGTNTVGGDDTECSAPFQYVHDDLAPQAPRNLATVPPSPTQDPQPVLHGIAEAGSTVSVFLDTDCSGTPIATLGAATFQGATGLPLTGLTPDVTHTVRASATDAAGNVSPCSDPLPVVVDTQPPAVPTAVHVVSGLPDGLDLVIGGVAEAGSRVQLWVDAQCTGSADSFGTADMFGTTGIPVTHSVPEGTRTIHVRATDEAGNVGACSAGLDVDVDRTAPDVPTDLALAGATPTDVMHAVVLGSAAAGSIVRIYRDANGGTPSCDVEVGSGTAAELSTGIEVDGLVEGANELHARAFDAVGNGSACSVDQVVVVVDTMAPAAPQGLDVVPASPTNDATPSITGNAESGSQIHLWVDDPTCGGSAQATGTDLLFENGGIELPDALGDGDHTVTATATDAAGNESPCSEAVSVTVDTAAPAAPVLDPIADGTDPDPLATGSGEPGSTVRLYLTDDCTGPVVVSGPAATLSSPGLHLGPGLTPQTYSVTATARDRAGNVGACSDAVTFTVLP